MIFLSARTLRIYYFVEILVSFIERVKETSEKSSTFDTRHVIDRGKFQFAGSQVFCIVGNLWIYL